MIQIKSTTSRDIPAIADQLYDDLRLTLQRRISRITGRPVLKEFLMDNLYNIITGSPEILILLNAEYLSVCRRFRYKKIYATEALHKVFNYLLFSRDKKKAYQLASALHVNTCPYCNRNYTVTIIEQQNGRRIVRPDFDHFFPKVEFPLLALSFYNLIPSCPVCNRSIKGAKATIYQKFIHPYEEGYDNTLTFNYSANDPESMVGIKANFDVKILLDKTDPDKSTRCSNNFNLFKLQEIYQASHADEIADIVRKFHVSGGTYLDLLSREYPALGTMKELYKIAFANFYNEEDFDKRPLSKLTKDIFNQLKFTVPTLP